MSPSHLPALCGASPLIARADALMAGVGVDMGAVYEFPFWASTKMTRVWNLEAYDKSSPREIIREGITMAYEIID